MAEYSTSVKTIGRSAGRSATAAAAYRSGSLIVDERTGDVHDYTKKQGVEDVSRLYPHSVADMGTAELWNRAEAAEKRKNSTVAREVLIALPHELDQFQRKELVEAIGLELVGRYGAAIESSIHKPDTGGDQRNFHVHMLMTTRRMNPDGSLGEKTRELDGQFNNPEIHWIREMVADVTNEHLEAAGIESRVDHRSLKARLTEALENGELEAAQELDRAPQIHKGPRVTQILREAESEGREPLGALDRAAANDSMDFDINAGKAELAEVVSMIDFIEKRDAECGFAHKEAIKENALRDKLTEAKSLLQKVNKAKINLAIKLDKGTPQFVLNSKELRAKMISARKEALAWREEHPVAAMLADKIGIKPETEKKSDAAASAYMKSSDRVEAKAWATQDKIDNARYEKLTKQLPICEAKFARLEKEVQALNSPDPETLQAIKEEVAQGIEATRPEIASFVDNNRADIAAVAADFGGVDAWISSDIIQTGNPAIDELSRKFAQFRSRMLREETARAEKNEHLMADAVRKAQTSFKKAFDSAFRSAAREAEPKVDHAAEARKRALEAAAAALRVPQQAAAKSSYVPTWKRGRHNDTDLKFEP